MPDTDHRTRLAFSGVLACVLAVCSSAFALDPSLDVSQYAHTAWRIREGFAKGDIYSVVQTRDGYLWLGTESGLLRFDGVRTVLWQPPPGQNLPSTRILGLLASRDGTLWIGTSKGLASWKDDKVTQYPQLAGQYVLRLLEDREGSVWVATIGIPNARLCGIQSGSVHCDGEDGSLGSGVFGLYEDSRGNLWVGLGNGLWRWKPGAAQFFPLPGQPNGIRALGEDDGGALLIGWRGGIARFVDGKTEPYLLPGTVPRFEPDVLLRDRDGGLWITSSKGLLHVHQGRTDIFAQSDGLSGDYVQSLFQDREGSIWAATLNGLDRFRNFAVTTFSASQGSSNADVGSILAGRDGNLWLGTLDGLKRWENGRFTPYGTRRSVSVKPDGKLNGHNPHSLYEDKNGRVWVSTIAGFGYLENNGFVPINGVPGGAVRSITGDSDGNLWAANLERGLFHLHGRDVQQFPWVALGRKDFATALAADPRKDGLWLGFFNGGIAYFKDNLIRESYGAANGLSAGWVSDLRFDPDGTLWVATEGGLSSLKDGHIATLTSKNGLPCDAVHWLIEDDSHSFWLYMPCGLVRITRSELETLASAVEKDKDAKLRIHVTVFDSSDGVRTQALTTGYTPHVSKSPDGKLWFAVNDGVSVVDPQHLRFNDLPPPVHVEQVIADHKTYDVAPDSSGRLPLPPRVHDLQIDYTALSLVAPEKVLFRYKLEGWDRDWQDVGTRRQAFYSNLPPRNYTFRVMACNNSGVWNEAGASLPFFVAPAYYQTWWFRSLCVIVVVGLVFAAHRLRLQQVERQFNARLEGRVAERTRIARDLHDTLLQSFQGTLLKFHAVTYMLPERPDAQKALETVVEQARAAITEGRDAIQGMRSSTLAGNDLARAINQLCDELTAAHRGAGNCPEVQVQVEGTPRDLAPILRDDIYRLSGEALRNAFLHARATRIEVEIRYDTRQFRVRVRDNGKGIDPKVLESGAREGHYGLPGMRERAKLVGGKLAVWSELDSGTEIELTIPASLAYAKSSVARESTSSKKPA